MIRPGFARTSSAASGLRFCGIIDEPVVNASDSWIKPNLSVDQMTISSAKRERCVAQIEAADRNSTAKSRDETASIALAIGLSKPRSSAV